MIITEMAKCELRVGAIDEDEFIEGAFKTQGSTTPLSKHVLPVQADVAFFAQSAFKQLCTLEQRVSDQVVKNSDVVIRNAKMTPRTLSSPQNEDLGE